MKSPLHLSTRSVRAPQSKPHLNIAIAYADSTTRRIAKRVCYRMIRRLHHSFDIRAFFWSFDSLGQSERLEHAAGIAASADMIFYSVNAAEELPAAARVWSDCWLALMGQSRGALVALLKSAGPINVAPLAAEIQLNALAQAARMEFFVKIFDRPMQDASSVGLRAAAKLTLGSAPATENRFEAVVKPACAFA